MKAQLQFVLILVFLNVMSCDVADDEPVRPYAGVDEELIPFFMSFEEEATKRGVSINLTSEKITASLEPILSFGILGRCERRSNGTKHITMESEEWDSRTYLDKEQLIFHELGHCALLRIHKEETNESNMCTSIMRSGRSTCWILYNESTREAYLEELFDLEND